MGHGNRHRNNTNTNNTGLIEDLASFVKRREDTEDANTIRVQRAEAELASRTADAKRRLDWIMKDSLENGATEKDPFWLRVACTAWQCRPHIGSSDNPYMMANRLNRLYIRVPQGRRRKAKPQEIDIGMIKFGPAGGVIGLKVYDRKGGVLFTFGEMENDFDHENDHWAPLLNDFYLLGDNKPALV